MVPHGTVGYGMVWYGTVWYCLVPYGTVWYCRVPYGAIQYCMVLYGTVWYLMVLYVATYSNTHVVPILDVWPYIESVFLCVAHMLFECVVATVWGEMCHKKYQNVSLFGKVSNVWTHIVSMCGNQSLKESVALVSIKVCPKHTWFTICGLVLFLCVATKVWKDL